MENQDSIYFYGSGNNFEYLSNFYKTNFVDELGNKFSCSEQYLMYWKAKTFEPENSQMLQSILRETNPNKIKALGRLVKNYNDATWSQIRFDVMVRGLRLKFRQNPTILGLLLSTGNKTIYEASKNDKIWGIGFYADQAINVDPKSYGTNLLGQALMAVRQEFSIRNEQILNTITNGT
jgi:ribA/ribD-fused uncharacterized protein